MTLPNWNDSQYLDELSTLEVDQFQAVSNVPKLPGILNPDDADTCKCAIVGNTAVMEDLANDELIFSSYRLFDEMHNLSIDFTALPTGTYNVYVDAYEPTVDAGHPNEKYTAFLMAQVAAVDESRYLKLYEVDWDLPTTTLNNLVDCRDGKFGIIDASLGLRGDYDTIEIGADSGKKIINIAGQGEINFVDRGTISLQCAGAADGIKIDCDSNSGIAIDLDGGYGIYADQDGGNAIYIDNDGNAASIYIDTSSTGTALSINTASAVGLFVLNGGTANSIETHNNGASSGDGIFVSHSGSGDGIRVDQDGAGNGIEIDNAGANADLTFVNGSGTGPDIQLRDRVANPTTAFVAGALASVNGKLMYYTGAAWVVAGTQV